MEERIVAEGCRDALVVWQDILLDGHHRYSICRKHNLPFRLTSAPDWIKSRGDALRWIVQNQLARRNLTRAQKRHLVEQLLKLNPEQSNRQIAESAQVDHKTVGTIREALNTRGEIPQVTRRQGKDNKTYPVTATTEVQSMALVEPMAETLIEPAISEALGIRASEPSVEPEGLEPKVVDGDEDMATSEFTVAFTGHLANQVNDCAHDVGLSPQAFVLQAIQAKIQRVHAAEVKGLRQAGNGVQMRSI